jgi:nonribosomal peptide synthetase DhbF
VEPDEIQAVIGRDPAVRQAVVMVREDRPGDRRLVAYVAANHGGVDEAGLRARMRAALPNHMMPSAVMVLDQLPVTVNGKLDRVALPMPDYLAVSSGTEPVTVPEEILCELFDEVLGTTGTGTGDSFFDLGGHSMLAMRLISRIRAVFGVDVGVRQLFQTPSVGALATIIQDIDHRPAD